MTNFKVGDLVWIYFSDGHRQEGIVREVPSGESPYYRVETKVWDKDTNVYCVGSSLELRDVGR